MECGVSFFPLLPHHYFLINKKKISCFDLNLFFPYMTNFFCKFFCWLAAIILKSQKKKPKKKQ